MILFWGSLLGSSACGVKLVVHQPSDIRRVCSATVLSIGIKDSQREYHEQYFPPFYAAVQKALGAKMTIIEAPSPAEGYTWEEAARIGRDLKADAVIGILIDDSARPPRRMQILKVVKSSNGKILAQQNRLIPPREDYAFTSEIRAIGKILECRK